MACCLAPVPFSCAQTPQANTTQVQVAAKQAQPRALWVWDGGVITQAAKSKQFLDFCKEKNIEIAYLHLGDFLSPKKRDASDPKHVTAQPLGDFLEAAHARGLRIEALDGDPSFTRADKHEDALQRLRLAIEYNVNILTGSLPSLEDDRLKNVGYICHRNCNVDQYEKIHITPDESKAWGIRGGDTLKVYETDAGKIGVLICYDVEFPELGRICHCISPRRT